MRDMKRVVLGVVSAALLLSGCGATVDGSAAKPKASASPSPRLIESTECRSLVSQAAQIADEMETQTGNAEQFTQLFDRISVLSARTSQVCTQASVKQSMTTGVYRYSLANAGYTACKFVLCDKSKPERNVVAGSTLIRRAVTAAAQKG